MLVPYKNFVNDDVRESMLNRMLQIFGHLYIVLISLIMLIAEFHFIEII